jgi:hypothetical protein
MDDAAARLTYSWFERPLVRIITIISIYLLGVIVAVAIQSGNKFFSPELLLLIPFLLPRGWIEGVRAFLPGSPFLGETVETILSWLGYVFFFALIAVIMLPAHGESSYWDIWALSSSWRLR